MDEILEIVVLGRAARNSANIKNRQPIGKMYVKAEMALDGMYSEIIEDELNVKCVEFTDDVRNFTSYSFKPQLKTLGRRFGKNLNEVREILTNIDGNAAMDELKEKGTLTINVAGVDEALTEEDLLIESAQKEGFEANSDNGVTVVIDTNLTEELIEEGFVREIISKIQTMRKEADFEVMDKIKIAFSDNAKICEIVKKNTESMKEDVLAADVLFDTELSVCKEWNINGENVKISVEKI